MNELAILFTWAIFFTDYQGTMPPVEYVEVIENCASCEGYFINGTVYLTTKKPDVAVHEFVHSLQPDGMTCMESEMEALRVQNQYTLANGIRGHATFRGGVCSE
jgi:hypothetical protein